MKNVTKFSLTLLTGLILTACGSSGGSDNKPSQTETPSSENIHTSTTLPSNTDTSTSNATGKALIVSGEDANVKVTRTTLTDSSLTKLDIEGKNITIGYESGIFAGNWLEAGSNSSTVYSCCGKYSNVRFGAYEGWPNENTYFFYKGTPTMNMPTAGVATYTGDSIISASDDKFEQLDDYVKGTASFNADFGAKTLTGELNHNGFQAINIKANIAGNSFTGKASSTDFSDTAEVEGKFYGTDAKELGGIFDNGSTWGGAFGGKR